MPLLIDEPERGPENETVKKPSKDEIVQFLLEETILHAASPASMERLASVAVPKSVPKDYMLFSMGEHCDSLHFIYEGCGGLVKTAPDGRQRILHRATAGEMVGAVPFFDQGEYPASFVAETDCLVLCFQRDALLKLFAQDPGVSLGLLGGLAERLRMFVAMIEQLSFDDVGQRLWTYLMTNSTSQKGNGFPRVVESIPTRERIATAIGTVREVVSRRLSRLSDSGHIRIEGRRVILLKPLEPRE